MAYSTLGFTMTYRAATAIDQFAAVDYSGANDLVAIATAGQGMGVAQRAVNSGELVPVQLGELTRALAGAAITRGNWVTGAASGFTAQVTTLAPTSLGVRLLGRAETSAASGMVYTLLLIPQVATNALSANAIAI